MSTSEQTKLIPWFIDFYKAALIKAYLWPIWMTNFRVWFHIKLVHFQDYKLIVCFLNLQA
jgi:hypothetical protein